MASQAVSPLDPPPPASAPPLRLDIFYSLILLASPMLWSFVDSWLLYFYLPPAGKGVPLVPAALYGVAIFIPRVINALLSPLIGYLSDNTRSRWGRRLPYIFAAAGPLAVCFVLLWTPPVPGESMINLWYLMGVLLFYNVAYVFLLVPYWSLMPEIAVTDAHRVRISMWGIGFQLLGITLAGMSGWLIAAQGYLGAALIYVALVVPLFYLPFLVLRERPDRQIAPAAQFSFIQSLGITLRNRAFLVLLAAGTCYWITTTFVLSVVPYVVTEICLLSEGDTAYFYLAAVLATVAAYPVVNWLNRKLGKWRLLVGALLATAVVLPGLAGIGPWLPLPLMAQGLIWIALEAMTLSGVVVLLPAFSAEIIDYDEQVTGQRREGAYTSAWGLLDQVANGLAGALLPLLLLLGRSQAEAQGPLGVRLVGPVGGVLLVAAFLILLRYPLKKGVNKQT